MRERIEWLMDQILTHLEMCHAVSNVAVTTPERVKTLRQKIICAQETARDDDQQQLLCEQMDDMFLVMQLYSYPGDYLRQQPTIERLAETMDKLEEDILALNLPRVRSRRRTVVRFGEPIRVTVDPRNRDQVGQLTATMQDSVQVILDELNSFAAVSAAR